jgi:two-component system sensor histidine kinase YesM
MLTFYFIDKPIERAIERKIGDSAREALYQTNSNIELFLEDMMKSVVKISMDPNINALLKRPEEFDEYTKLRLRERALDKLFISNYSAQPQIALTDLHGNWLSSFYMSEQLYMEYTGMPWYLQMIGNSFQTKWSFDLNIYPNPEISPGLTLVKTVTELHSSRNIGMILLWVSEYDVRKYLEKLEGEVYLIDSNGKIVSSPDLSMIGIDVSNAEYMSELQHKTQGQFTTEQNGTKWFASFDTINQTDWKIVQLVEYDTVFKEIFDIRRVNFLIYILIFIVFMFITLSISYSISRPINLLNRRMQEIEEKQFNSILLVSGPKEIATLIGTYNEMLKRIRDLLQRVKDTYQKKEDMRFRALQAQINPHFLLNTLNNIKWMAYIHDDREVGEMLSHLGSIMEVSIGKGVNEIPLMQEIQYIDNYITLMKLKYNEKLAINYDIPKNFMEQEVFKFILQPIVENSIIHGIDFISRKGEITIGASSNDGCVLLTVQDNGIGIREDKLMSIRQLLESDSDDWNDVGIGIRNVHDRIRFQYGERYGLRIDSTWGIGTKVTIVLPIKTVRSER